MELTKRGDDQLALVDEHISFGSLKADRSTIVDDLTTSARSLQISEERLEDLEQQVTGRLGLEARVAELQDELNNPVFQDRSKWEKEKAFLGWARARLEKTSGQFALAPGLATSAPAVSIPTPNGDLLDRVRAIVDRLDSALIRLRQEYTDVSAMAEAGFEKANNEWLALDEASREEFRSALKQAGVGELHALHKERSDKEEQLRYIVDDVEPALAQARKSVKAIRSTRLDSLRRLGVIQASVHGQRIEQLPTLHERLKSVRVEVVQNGDRRDYYKYLQSLFAGSGVLKLDAQLERVVERLLPVELAEFMLTGDAKGLSDCTGVTLNAAQRMIAHLSVGAKLALQVLIVEDLPIISLRRAGEQAFTPLRDLSDGERCSAILSIALLEKSRPLLIDQPEDELDHQYVIEDIVGNIRAIKADRQIITATHDANIPVLGDAELVFRVAKLPGEPRCTVLAEGTLDQQRIVDYVLALEGGLEAFEQRRRKYMMPN